MAEIIGVSGRKQSGKNSVCDFLQRNNKELFGCVQECQIQQFPCAGPLKRMCVEIFGLEERQVYGSDDDKNTLTRYRWEDLPHYSDLYEKVRQLYFDDYCRNRYTPEQYYSFFPRGYMTAREILQQVGTEIGRRMNHDLWVEALIRDINKSGVDIALVPDVRFPNEVLGIQKAGGVVLRLTRDPANGQDQHISETALDAHKFDWEQFDDIIDNRKLGITETNQYVVQSLTRLGIVVAPKRKDSLFLCS